MVRRLPFLALLLVLGVVLVACGAEQAGTDEGVAEAPVVPEVPRATGIIRFAAAGPSLREVNVRGPLTLRLAAMDGVVEFAVPELGLAGVAAPGPASEVVFAEPGVYSLVCTRGCPAGRNRVRITINP